MLNERQFKFVNPVTGEIETFTIAVIQGFDFKEQIDALAANGQLDDHLLWLLANGWRI